MRLKNGTLLQGGKYKIEQALGQGSFGITYLATAKFTTDGALGKMDVMAKVAIKEFFMGDINGRKPDGSTVEGSSASTFTNYKRRFRKEAENLAKLSHPNVVRVFDVFDENNTTYYVMEYLGETSLNRYIKGKKGLTEKECVTLTKGIGAALQYMHNSLMLHLDLKPGNIMLRDGEPVLIDFGLAKQFNADGRPETSTVIGQGTPGYAPLEQEHYNGKPTKGLPYAMDVYALGGTMFKMLTGHTPPNASSIFNEGFPRHELAACHTSDRLTGIIERAMAPARNIRYQTVDELLSALDDDKEGGALRPKSVTTDTEATDIRNSGASETHPAVEGALRQGSVIQSAAAGRNNEARGSHHKAGNIPAPDGKPAYNWRSALIALAAGSIWIACMLDSVVSRDATFDALDTDGWIVMWAFVAAFLFIVHYLLSDGRRVSKQRWRQYKIAGIALFCLNTLVLRMWNTSLTMAYVVLSVLLLVIVFILLLMDNRSSEKHI